ncbi:MAG: phosphoglycolate phosphatase [Oceanicoccus sp.]|jgi:phosphoglycolate phosphatase
MVLLYFLMRYEVLMLNKKLYVFDLDGTIVDTVEDIAEAMNFVLREEGLPEKSLDHYRKLVGNGTLNMVAKTLGSDFNRISEAHSSFEIRYSNNCLVRSKPFPNIENLLGAISDSGNYLAVLTNKIQPLAQKIVSASFPNIVFDAVVGLSPSNKAKPNPDSLLKLINQFDVDECYMIGDTIVDIETAHNAGVHPIAVLWGYSSKLELESMRPEQVFNDTDSMFAMFGLNVATLTRT